jgi:hypothetical protein
MLSYWISFHPTSSAASHLQVFVERKDQIFNLMIDATDKISRDLVEGEISSISGFAKSFSSTIIQLSTKDPFGFRNRLVDRETGELVDVPSSLASTSK